MPIFEDTAYTSIIHVIADMNAHKITPTSLLKNIFVANTMHIEAPNAAADDTPMVKGLTRGFLVTDCIAVPDIALSLIHI